MNGITEFLRRVRPSGWLEVYQLAERVADGSVSRDWQQRSQAVSEELIQIAREPFGPRGLASGFEDVGTAGWVDQAEWQEVSRIAEQVSQSGKILVTSVLLHLDAKGCPVGIPCCVEHALTLVLTVVPVWGVAGQKLLETRDDECDRALETLPGYMMVMLADDFAGGSARQSRVRSIWSRQVHAKQRSGAFSLAVH